MDGGVLLAVRREKKKREWICECVDGEKSQRSKREQSQRVELTYIITPNTVSHVMFANCSPKLSFFFFFF